VKHALKEWAVICKALAEGRQSLILRKGGIAEPTGDFRLEQTRFWLFPTYTHQQRAGIQAAGMPLLDEAEKEQPPAGTIRISHWAEVTGVYHVHNLTRALLLAHLHLWSDEAVRKRFEYREPGIYVMPVRVYSAPQILDIPDAPRYEGCHSWVELDEDLSTTGSIPVLDESAMLDLHRSLDMLLNPTAIV
jgi:hypothetical protein